MRGEKLASADLLLGRVGARDKAGEYHALDQQGRWGVAAWVSGCSEDSFGAAVSCRASFDRYKLDLPGTRK